jgi:hypothetical protein
VSLAARCQCCACRGTGSDVIAGSARIAAHHRGSSTTTPEWRVWLVWDLIYILCARAATSATAT